MHKKLLMLKTWLAQGVETLIERKLEAVNLGKTSHTANTNKQTSLVEKF